MASENLNFGPPFSATKELPSRLKEAISGDVEVILELGKMEQ